ncbi:MAG: HAD family hydrolase [Acutalibacteraceae bacterium]
MIKNIVFDMGGVLIDCDVKKTIRQFFKEEYHDVLFKEVFGSPLWDELDRGTKLSNEAIPEMLSKIPKETHALITEMVDNFYPYMPPFPEMYGFIKQLKDAGYKIYLLSNASRRFYDRKDYIPAISLFDGLFISADYKMLKPEKEIYETFFKKFSLKPEECFFIDDRATNIEGAESCGMKGFVFRISKLGELEKTLNALGVNF